MDVPVLRGGNVTDGGKDSTQDQSNTEKPIHDVVTNQPVEMQVGGKMDRRSVTSRQNLEKANAGRQTKKQMREAIDAERDRLIKEYGEQLASIKREQAEVNKLKKEWEKRIGENINEIATTTPINTIQHISLASASAQLDYIRAQKSFLTQFVGIASPSTSAKEKQGEIIYII